MNKIENVFSGYTLDFIQWVYSDGGGIYPDRISVLGFNYYLDSRTDIAALFHAYNNSNR